MRKMLDIAFLVFGCIIYIQTTTGELFSEILQDNLEHAVDPRNNHEVWGGECGLPPLPARQEAVKLAKRALEHKKVKERAIFDHLRPWDHYKDKRNSSWAPWTLHTLFVPRPQQLRFFIRHPFFRGDATLIRAKSDEDKSNIAITTAQTCHDIRAAEEKYRALVVLAVPGPPTVKKMISIYGCIPHWDWSPDAPDDRRSENNIGIMVLDDHIPFTHGITPACMPYSDESIPDGTPGFVTATVGYDFARGPLSMVVLKTQDTHSCGATAAGGICVGGYDSHDVSASFSAVPNGGAFHTLRNETNRFVLTGLVQTKLGEASHEFLKDRKGRDLVNKNSEVTVINRKGPPLPQFVVDVRKYVNDEKFVRVIKAMSLLWPPPPAPPAPRIHTTWEPLPPLPKWMQNAKP